MDDIPEAREVPDSTLAAMVDRAMPGWDLQRATAIERGFCSVYRIVATCDRTTQECYLKISPDGQTWAIPTEARIQAVLDSHTSIPVPEVLGVTDDHETLPTPHYLMRALPGEDLPYEAIGRLEDDALGRLAREMGRYLGELHSVPALERFGHVRNDGPALDGNSPSGDPATLTVDEPHEDWPRYLQKRVTAALDRHETSQFSDLTGDLERWFEAGIDDLTGSFEPVLGRNDHGLHNLRIDSDTGEITAMLDWGYTLAVPAAFDFEYAVYLFSGAFLAGLPDVSDRRSLVRESMLVGYETTAPARVERVSTPEPLYEALAMVRIMNDFHSLDVPDGTEQAAADRIRADVRAILDQ